MLDAIIIDFETRSKVNLLERGTDIYGQDPSTDILCLAAYDLETNQKWLWYPADGALPQDLVEAIEDAEFIAAHNARFDQLIWECVGVNDYGFPAIALEKWYCTSAQCRVNAVPASLDAAARFLTGKKMKMVEGRKLIKLLSIPNDQGNFNTDAHALKRMGDYCLQDTVATVAVVKATRPMTKLEHKEWLDSERVNDFGVKVDTELAELCTKQADAEASEMADELEVLTDGAVTAVTQNARVKKWALAKLEPAVIDQYLTKIVTDDDGNEQRKITFDKGARAELTAAINEELVEIPDVVAEVLAIVEQGNKSSVAKFKKMVLLADDDDKRIRGAYMYAGASQTKRFSAKGVQPHNFRRDCIAPDRVPEAKQLLASGSAGLITGDSVMETLSMLLRPTLMPDEGKTFVVCDWSAIEGRFLPWLSDSRGGERVLDVFRSGQDIYMHTADGMGINDRQIGKVATLALGYQGGVNAFNAMGRAYGMVLPAEQAQEIVDKWRGANNWAVAFWKQLDRAAMRAMQNPKVWYSAGRIKYLFMPELIHGTLICLLPDESIIQYPIARIEQTETPWGETRGSITYAKAALTPKADAVDWPRSSLYAGLAAENCTQAISASLLRYAIGESLDERLDIAIHVHDELVIECEIDKVQNVKAVLQEIMETPPAWAAGLPLKAVPEVTGRYSK